MWVGACLGQKVVLDRVTHCVGVGLVRAVLIVGVAPEDHLVVVVIALRTRHVRSLLIIDYNIDKILHL